MPQWRTSRHGEVREESAEQSQTRDARAQARHAPIGPLGQEGHEPQAGDRHRLERSAPRRRQGPAQAPPEVNAGSSSYVKGLRLTSASEVRTIERSQLAEELQRMTTRRTLAT